MNVASGLEHYPDPQTPGSLCQGELGFPSATQHWLPHGCLWTALQHPSEKQAKCGLQERWEQPLHTHSPGRLLMRSLGTGTNCLNQMKSNSVIKALLSLSLTLEKLLNLFKELSSILIPCVPDKEQSSQSIGSLLGFFGWWDSGLEEREGINVSKAERQKVFKIVTA